MNCRPTTFALLIGCLLAALATACIADTDPDAVRNADAFLTALKIFELAEGKEAVAETSWPGYVDQLPVLLNGEKLFDGMFATDASGIVGYKRLLQAKVQSQGGGELTEKYLLISYREKQNGKWRVWAFIKIAGIDVDHEIESAKEALKQYANYRNYAFSLGISGRLLGAKQALLLVSPGTYSEDRGAYFKQQDSNILAAIDSICGR